MSGLGRLNPDTPDLQVAVGEVAQQGWSGSGPAAFPVRRPRASRVTALRGRSRPGQPRPARRSPAGDDIAAAAAATSARPVPRSRTPTQTRPMADSSRRPWVGSTQVSPGARLSRPQRARASLLGAGAGVAGTAGLPASSGLRRGARRARPDRRVPTVNRRATWLDWLQEAGGAVAGTSISRPQSGRRPHAIARRTPSGAGCRWSRCTHLQRAKAATVRAAVHLAVAAGVIVASGDRPPASRSAGRTRCTSRASTTLALCWGTAGSAAARMITPGLIHAGVRRQAGAHGMACRPRCSSSFRAIAARAGVWRGG